MTKALWILPITALLLLAPCAAGAEESTAVPEETAAPAEAAGPLEINWNSDAVPSTEGSGDAASSVSGEEQSDSAPPEAAAPEGFVTFDEISLRMYLVPELQAVELSGEDQEMGFLAYYETEDHSEAVGIMLANADGLDARSYKDSLEQLGNVSDITDVIVNGRSGVRYRIEEEDALYVGFPTQAGYTIEFSFAPASGDFLESAELMLSSIQPM